MEDSARHNPTQAFGNNLAPIGSPTDGERNILGRCQTHVPLMSLLGIRQVRLPGLSIRSHFCRTSRRRLTRSLSGMNIFEVREEVGVGRSPAERLASVGAGGRLVGGEDGAEWSECVV